MKAPTRSTQSGRAYRDLQNLARRQGRPTDELLALYALEGFLQRLTLSSHRDDLILKGGVLMAAYEVRRPTRDVDFQARALENQEGTVLGVTREIAAIQLDDGLTYDVSSAKSETIREGDDYSGVRVLMTARLATARLSFNVDVNVGDPIWPAPLKVKLPRLLGGSISLRGYPLAMVLAEKLVTALERGVANTRWRDFADLYLLSETQEIDGSQLQRAIRVVAEYRKASLAPLDDVLDGFADLAQSRWRAWIAKQRMTDRLPSGFADLLLQIFNFSGPALSTAPLRARWDPRTKAWTKT